MLTLSQAVVVEGKYDKIRLSSLIDALILPVNGFRIYHDKETLSLLRKLALDCGIIILTDSDAAGVQIRGFLRSASTEGTVYHAYIPDRYGKERRKVAPSAEGKLGVEGFDDKTLLQAFYDCGACENSVPKSQKTVTNVTLYTLGLSGKPDSARLRRAVLRKLGLPERMSTKAMAQLLSTMVTEDELAALVEKEAENAIL